MVSGIIAKVTLAGAKSFCNRERGYNMEFLNIRVVRSHSYSFDQLEILYLFKRNMDMDVFVCISVFVGNNSD